MYDKGAAFALAGAWRLRTVLAAHPQHVPADGEERNGAPTHGGVACLPGGGSGLLHQESQHVSPVDEALWKALMEPERDRWRARALDPERTESEKKYARGRERRLTADYTDRLQGCRKSGSVVSCGCPLSGRKRWNTCRQHLMCWYCRQQRQKKQEMRIRRGLLAAWERVELSPRKVETFACDCEKKGERCQGRPDVGEKNMCVLITLTLRDTGDVKADRANLAAGWERFRKRYHRAYGACEFVAVHEMTAGRKGIGHPHMHVVAIWPYRCWKMLARWWRQACPQSARINLKASYSVRGAAKYISKYVAKGMQTQSWTPQLRARTLAAYYNTRWFSTSEGFFIRTPVTCPCCGQPFREDIVLASWVLAILDARRAARGPPATGPERERCYQGAIPGIS